MINRKLWLCIYTSLTFLGYINTAKAETNYEALHLNHNIVAKYENGGLGYKAVSKDSYGGYSYGKWQISTKRSKNGLSTFDYFIQYTKNKNIIIYNTLQNAGGYEAAFCGKSIFIDTWKNLANNRNFQIWDSWTWNHSYKLYFRFFTEICRCSVSNIYYRCLVRCCYFCLLGEQIFCFFNYIIYTIL